jgi:DNA repair and recombination protein RAD52
MSVGNFEDNLEMWDLTPDLEDIVKPLAVPEPPQTSATTAKNQMVAQDGLPHSLCHQKPQEKPEPWHLQTYSTNQPLTGSRELYRTKIKGRSQVSFCEL